MKNPVHVVRFGNLVSLDLILIEGSEPLGGIKDSDGQGPFAINLSSIDLQIPSKLHKIAELFRTILNFFKSAGRQVAETFDQGITNIYLSNRLI